MSRDAQIWLVVDGHPRNAPLLAAFTELPAALRWLGRRVARDVLDQYTDWYVIRCANGGGEVDKAIQAHAFWCAKGQ